ncbi:MAG: hypothetical protein ABSG63_09060 [Spirochaetia bacterium]
MYRALLPEGKDTLPKLLKVVGSIAQGIHIFSGQEHTITDLINHALIMQSIPVAADLWESYIGAGGWTANRDARDALETLAGEKEMGAIAAVSAFRTLGRRAVEMAMIVRAGVTACREVLEKDPLYAPCSPGLAPCGRRHDRRQGRKREAAMRHLLMIPGRVEIRRDVPALVGIKRGKL